MADESRVMQLIAAHQADVAVAAVNGPESVVVSGRASAIDSIVANATAQGISATRLQVSHAFHSPLMEPMIGAFRQVAESVTYHPPGIDVISNVTGARLERREISAEYWCRHVRAPVQFARGVQAMAARSSKWGRTRPCSASPASRCPMMAASGCRRSGALAGTGRRCWAASPLCM
jgi:acyl transferase domain-containing protein